MERTYKKIEIVGSSEALGLKTSRLEPQWF